MTITHIIPNLNTGGGERFLVDLANEQCKHHNVHILTLNPLKATYHLPQQLDERIHIHSLKKKYFVDILLLINVYKHVRYFSPNIINTHLKALHYCLFVVLFTQYPVIHTVQNIAQKEEPNRLLRGLNKLFFRAKRVLPIAVSQEVKNSIEEVYGVTSKVITNATNLPQKTSQFNDVQKKIEELKPQFSAKVFINVGRIAPQKNQMMLIRAFKKLIEENKSCVLLILGHIEERYQYIEREINNEKSSNVYLLGDVDNVGDYLRCADAFCLSSNYEGLPLSLLEAMSIGVIPICTPVGGIPEVIVNMENGLLSTDTSQSEYYQALLNYFQLSEEKKREISRQARRTFTNEYSIPAIFNQYEQLYRKYTKTI